MNALRVRLNRALASGHLPQLRYQRNGRYAIREGVILSAYDIPSPIFNTAAVLEPDVPFERAFALAWEFFGAEYGWSMLVEADAGQPVETDLGSRGWRPIGEMPALLLSPIPAPPPLPAGLVIRRVVDEAGLREYLAPFGDPPPAALPTPASGAEMLVPANIDELLFPSAAILQDPDVALFLGCVDGKAVGGAALYRTDGIAELGGVSVAPGFRRRGFGAALTWAAISEGAARGCDAAALHSTEMAYSIYTQMGFRPFAVHRRYVLGRVT